MFAKSRTMFDPLNKQEINDVIKTNFVGHLGCHADDKTYVVPLSYACDDKYLYARSFEGMKLDMMRKNPRVCFQIDQMENTADWKSVVIWGTFEELNGELRNKALKKLMSRPLPNLASNTVKFSTDWPFPISDLNSIDGIVYRIAIQEKTGRREIPDPQNFPG
jgi:nitroimidazol reductase NimA-like FMN-containing flavoprotein (pyridoxamine 5'-phosphate oxidase superfamily)